MNADEYLTLAEPGYAQTRVLGSRFFGSAWPIAALPDCQPLLDAEQRSRHDATHWCYAGRCGWGAQLSERSADAGEPHGSAGLPILREIRKRHITDSCVIVTRYFGGTKLGTGNLARAYAECAGLALDAAVIRRCRRVVLLEVESLLDDQGLVYAIANRFGALVNADFRSDGVRFRLEAAYAAAEALTAALREESAGRIRIRESES